MSGGGLFQCPGCGAKIPRPAGGGGILKCEYCGTPLQVPGVAPAAFPPPMYVPREAPGGPVGMPGDAPPGYGAPPGFGAAVPQFQVPQLAKPRRRSRVKIMLIVLLVLVAGSGLAFFIWYMAWSRIDGRIESTGGTLGSWSASFEECRSGDAFHPDFFGVDLRAGSPGAHVQVQGGDSGATVVVGGPAGDGSGVDLTRADCSLFDVLVESGNAEVNDVDSVQGRLHVDCTAPGGGRIRIDADFRACH